MKKNDIALILAVGFVSAVFALIISNFVITSSGQQKTAEVVEPIVTDFIQPDNRYFNNNSVNPTQLIEIGDQSNPRPFN